MRLDNAHDGRIVALLARDRAASATRALGQQSVDLVVTDPAGGRWRYGSKSEPDAVIGLDAVVLAKLLARRRSPAATRERSTIHGDVKTAMILLTSLHNGR
jgi:hypothetical protein